MQRTVVTLLATVVAMTIFAACKRAPSAGDARDTLAFAVNATRIDRGLPALTRSYLPEADAIDEAMRIRAQSGRRGCKLSHDESYSILACSGAESGKTACKASTAWTAIDIWLRSRDHRAVLLGESRTQYGVGVTCNDTHYFAVVVFA